MLNKIAVVASGNIPSKWANSINTMRHANAFKQLGYDVSVHSVMRLAQSIELKKIKNIWDFYGVDELSISYERDTSLNYFNTITAVRILTSVLNRLSQGRFTYWQDPEKKISDKLKGEGIDLCYARSYRVVGYNIKNCIPTVMETHNYRPHKSRDLLKVLQQSDSEYLIAIVTIHKKIKSKLVELGVDQKKIIVLDDAVDKSRFDCVSDDMIVNRRVLGLPERKKIVGYLGSLKPGKAIHKILESAKECDDENILFVIAGGELEEVNFWKTNEFYRADNTKFIGFLEGTMGPIFLKACDVLIMPYDTKEKKMVMDLETTSPIKLFEYMASKRPIISTKIPVIEKILINKKEGVLVSDGNYIKAVKTLVSDAQMAKKMGLNAYEKSENFTYVRRCKAILDCS